MEGSPSTLKCPRLDMLFLNKERRDESLYKLSFLSSSLLTRHLPSLLAACRPPYPSIHGTLMIEVCSCSSFSDGHATVKLAKMRLCHPLALDLLDDLLSHIIDDPARQPAHAEIIRGSPSLPALQVREKKDVSNRIERCTMVRGEMLAELCALSPFQSCKREILQNY